MRRASRSNGILLVPSPQGYVPVRDVSSSGMRCNQYDHMSFTKCVPGPVHRSDFRYADFAPLNPLTLVLAENERNEGGKKRMRYDLPSFSFDCSGHRIVVAIR